MKKIVLVFISLLMLISFSACNKKDDDINNRKGIAIKEDISGDYYAIRCEDEDGTELVLDGEVLHLEKDGTGYFEIAGERFSINWTLDNNEFYFIDEEDDEFNGKYYNGMISGSYFNGYNYLLTNDKTLYQNMNTEVDPIPNNTNIEVETKDSSAVYYTVQTLYEPTYGIKTAYALVPYGWKASVSVQWGMCSSMYPAVATIKLVSPDNGAMIEIVSTMGYLQMARNGYWVPEGTYIDLYNIYLNYRNAHNYNDYILGLLGYKGTILNEEKPTYDFQLALNGEANTLLSVLSSINGTTGKQCEGSYEKTSYFITEGNAYEVVISSAVIMAETLNGLFDTYQWIVPYTATFTAYNEDAYSNYYRVFDNVVGNSNFSNEFIFVVQKNAEYINEMIHNYLMEKVYSPSSGDITSWDGQYQETEADKIINAWSDVITERDEYTTLDGKSIKVSTQYDSVYQDGDNIYMGPQTSAPSGWTELNKKGF